MASITIRNLDDAIKARLRMRAASHGRSMEDEVRTILRKELDRPDPETDNLAERIRKRFAPFGDVELMIPPRDSVSEPPDFDDLAGHDA